MRRLLVAAALCVLIAGADAPHVESWTVSPDQRVYGFKLRETLEFHNGDPCTTDDVKFSVQRAKGKLLHETVREVTVVSSSHVRFALHEPWPDSMSYDGIVTGAGWVVPKKYVEQGGDEGFPSGIRSIPIPGRRPSGMSD